ELLQPRERPGLVCAGGEVDPFEQPAQLLRAPLGDPLRLVARQLRRDLVEADAIAAIVPARWADRDAAAGEDLRDAFRDLADAIILAGPPDIEDLTVHGVARRLGRACHRLTDVLDVHDRPPGAAVADHRDRPRGPGQGAEV